MQAGVRILENAAAEPLEDVFLGAGEILVRREGYSRISHLFTHNGRKLARLKWRGMRRATYEAEGLKYDITISPLDRIKVVSESGSESMLIEKSPANSRRETLRVEMAEGDNFQLFRCWDSRLRSDASLTLHKAFYASTLLVYRFNTTRRTQTTVRIEVKPTMKWEAKFIHRLLALVVCKIIIERRRSGNHPHRIKEKETHNIGRPARGRRH